jgi:hypothetical protein
VASPAISLGKDGVFCADFYLPLFPNGITLRLLQDHHYLFYL